MNILKVILISSTFVLLSEITLHADGIKPQDYKAIKLNRMQIIQRSHWDESNGVLSDEYYQSEKIKVLSAKRKELIKAIRKIITTAKEPLKLNYKFRLARLFVEEYRATSDNDQKVALKYVRDTYAHILSKYPTDKRNDESLFYLAMTYLDEGMYDQSTLYFTQLQSQHEKSRYIYETWLLLADYHFRQNNWKQSLSFYDKLMLQKNSHASAYATYRKAWCLYNLKQTRESLEQFYLVIKPASHDVPKYASLRREALKDIIFPLKDLKLANEAILLFRTEGDPVFHEHLHIFATLYAEAGNYKDSIGIWNLLISSNSAHPDNAKYDLEIVRSLRMMNKLDAAVRHLFTRARLYKEHKLFGEFETLAKGYALEYHHEAQETKDEKIYEISRIAYLRYLELFSAFPAAAQIKFNLAEIYYHQNKYNQASIYYLAAYDKLADEKTKQLSLWRAVSSIYEELNIERKQNKSLVISTDSRAKLADSADTIRELITYSNTEARFLKTSALYLQKYPKASEFLETKYVQSYLHYIHYDFSNALKGFDTLINQPEKSDLKITSALIILDIQNRQKAYKQIIATTTGFLQNPHLNRNEFKVEVRAILRHTVLKLAQIEEEAGRYATAAEQYDSFVTIYGKEEPSLTVVAKYNAAICYEKADNFMAAQTSQENFIAQYPKNPLIKEFLLKVGKRYELWADFKNAAAYLERFANEFGSDLRAPTALRLAAIYSWGSGNKKKALQIVARHISLYPKQSDMLKADKNEIENIQTTAQHNPLLSSVHKDELKFYNIRIKGGESQLSRAMKEKLTILKQIEKKYAQLIATKESQNLITGFAQLANTYHHLSQEILNAPVPKELSAKEHDTYVTEISKQFVVPFRNKAKYFANMCLSFVEEKQILSSLNAQCYAVYSKIDPENYPNTRTLYLSSSIPVVVLPENISNSVADNSAIERFSTESGANKLSSIDEVLPVLYHNPVIPNEAARYVAEAQSENLSFKELNLLRNYNPAAAVPQILKQIKKSPNNIALHNLLGLTYMGLKNYPAAKTIWYAMVARGIKSSSIENNLGVIAILEGKDELAQSHFEAATKQEGSRESWLNLGHLSLKYRNGKYAQDCFRQALHNSEDQEAKAGYFTASIQLRDWEKVKEDIKEKESLTKNNIYFATQMELFKRHIDKLNSNTEKFNTPTEYLIRTTF